MKRFSKLIDRIGQIKVLQAMRNGLIMTIPVLTLGSFALVLMNLPIEGYSTFIMTFANGLLWRFGTFIHQATFGFLSLYITLMVTAVYIQNISTQNRPLFMLGAISTSLVVFAIFSGTIADNVGGAGLDQAHVDISSLGVRGMFTALITSTVVAPCYAALSKSKRLQLHLYSDGSDASFTNAVTSFLPFIICVSGATLVSLLIHRLLHVDSLNELFARLLDTVFANADADLPGGILYVLLSGLMWFFGVHGGDVLENVATNTFMVWTNQTGGVVVNKTFIDVFALMGGCGTGLCLLIAIWIHARRQNLRDLSRLSTVTILFNINEIIVFGLPVVLNPFMLVPFLLTPILCTLTSALSVALGLMPAVQNEVAWTTPVLLSGYLATGSIAGSIVQFVNLLLGVALYSPFVLLFERKMEHKSHLKLEKMVEMCKLCEKRVEKLELLNRRDGVGEVARLMISDLRQAIAEHRIEMYYQAHHDSTGKLVGAEALMRWRHPSFGMIYPPLVVSLAAEGGLLEALEKEIFELVARDIAFLAPVCGDDFHMAVNVTPDTLRQKEFLEFLSKLVASYGIKHGQMMIEVTEQMAMEWSKDTEETLAAVRDLGILLAIDDFSMGHTSIQYIQSKNFSVIKLDGSLVRNITEDERNAEIVSSIINLAKQLDCMVVAEYVENREQFERLKALGCFMYQGYLFSPAIGRDEFVQYVKDDVHGHVA